MIAAGTSATIAPSPLSALYSVAAAGVTAALPRRCRYDVTVAV